MTKVTIVLDEPSKKITYEFPNATGIEWIMNSNWESIYYTPPQCQLTFNAMPGEDRNYGKVLQENRKFFVLRRNEDESGVSGTGDVAEGCVFSDGTAVLRWKANPHQSTAIYKNIAELEAIHGHGGKTVIVYCGN